MHRLRRKATHTRNMRPFTCTSLIQILAGFFSGYVTHPSTLTDRVVSHGERRVAALNDRCLFSAPQVSRSDSLGGRGARRAAVMSIQ